MGGRNVECKISIFLCLSSAPLSQIWALNLPCYLSFFISFQSLNSIACKFRTPTGTQHTNKIPLQTQRESLRQTQESNHRNCSRRKKRRLRARNPHIENQEEESRISFIYLSNPPISFLCYPPSLSLFITEKDKEKEKEREISFVILHCPLCSGQGFSLDRNLGDSPSIQLCSCWTKLGFDQTHRFGSPSPHELDLYRKWSSGFGIPSLRLLPRSYGKHWLF